MTIDELKILLPQINELISGYEEGVRKKISRSNAEEAASLALSLHLSPIQSMRFAMNTMDAASITPEEMEAEYKSQLLAQEKQEIEKPTKEKSEPFTKKWLGFEQDCEIVGGDQWYDVEKRLEKGTKIAGIQIPKKVGYKLTNPIKMKVKVDPLFFLEEFESNTMSKKRISECFDCKLNYTAEFMYPSIEVMWEFEKLLKSIFAAIKQIKKNMNPAELYANICNIKAFVGKNFLCPSMMMKINLMLPALFMKYSLDLGKISVDANFVLGGIIKMAISFIATFLENIRALLIPFLDCYINAAKSVSGYIKSVAQAISKGIDETAKLADRAVQVLHKSGILLSEIFNDNLADFNKKENEIREKVKEIEEDYAKARKELQETIEKLKKGNNENLPEKKIISLIEEKLDATELLLNSLPAKYGGNYPDSKSFKENPLIVNVKNLYVKKYNKKEEDFFALNGQQFQAFLIEFLSVNFKIENFYFEKQKKEQEEKISKIEKDIKEKKEAAEKTKKEVFEKNKDSLSYKMATREKKIFENIIKVEEAKEGKSILNNWLSKRYSFNLENSYVDHEYLLTRKIKSSVKKYSSDPINSIANFIDKEIVARLIEAKAYVNDFFGNVINALKNLNIILEQNTFTQFQILGEIMQLAHIIRAFRLVGKLIDEGFEGCEKLSENKAQEKILKDIVEEVSENEMSAKIISKENAETKSEEEYLKIYAKKGDHAYLTRLKDCSDTMSYLEKSNPNLDSIYDSMKAGMYGV